MLKGFFVCSLGVFAFTIPPFFRHIVFIYFFAIDVHNRVEYSIMSAERQLQPEEIKKHIHSFPVVVHVSVVVVNQIGLSTLSGKADI